MIHTKIRLNNKIAIKGLKSLQFSSEKLKNINEINSIIFVGSSLTGKTTLVDAIRKAIQLDSDLKGYISVPKRIITRPKRENDNIDENDFVSTEQFNQMVQNGDIYLHWIREMEGSRTEQYGFLVPESETIPVFSANNAIIYNKESVQPVDVIGQSLIIAVYAPEHIRKVRLLNRSPDLIKEKPQEVIYRLSDKANRIIPHAHIVVKNYGNNIDLAKKDIIELLKLLIKNDN